MERIEQWLVSMETPMPMSASLREAVSNRYIGHPSRISLGPRYRRNVGLSAMEEEKESAAKIFVSDIRTSYRKVSEMVEKAREFYGEDLGRVMSNEAFSRMMLLDACFVLQFIRNVKWGFPLGNIPMDLYDSVVKDMFLLENQLPFVILEALIELEVKSAKDAWRLSLLRRSDIDRFIGFLIETPNVSGPLRRMKRKPDHLLDLLRQMLLTDLGNDVSRGGVKYETDLVGWWYGFHTAADLKKVGIKLERSSTHNFNDVRFKRGLFYGKLFLPPMLINKHTRDLLSNLIAYELSIDDPAKGIISYVCLLDALINNAEDVKELRSADIFYSTIDKDQEVADLFNEIAKGLIPNYQNGCLSVLREMEEHSKSSFNRQVADLFDTYFSSPWKTISLVAAIVLLFLTAVQTYYAVFSPGN